MNNIAVSVEDVSKQFKNEKRFALKHINATFFKNQITGIVGPDGAGKTTLIRLICGLLSFTEGNISVLGLSPKSEQGKLQDKIGYMPQKFGLYEDLTVLENMNLYAKLNGVRDVDRVETFERMLKFTDLKRFTDRLAKFLSGGMKQKLGLACAMMGKPEILILDEPTVGVDPISRRELWQMCQDLMSEQHTVIWSTSYLDEAQQCDRVILLHEGQVRFSGQPQAFYECVENKVFQFEPQSGIREALEKTLTKPHVVDAVIQGKNIRVVLESAEYQSEFKHLKATPPRFEDAFVYQLEGKFARTSVLSDYLKSKPKSNVLPIEAVDLTKKFGDFTATENISFKINQGEIFGLLGPNGAGKSTTFKMLCGLVTPTSGQALVSGISLSTSSSDARNHIGYMAQKFSLYSDLSVIQNLEFFAGIYGLKLQHKRRIIKEMLSIFDLQHFRNTTTGLLSLGYKQRLALACAIMHDPDVLFLDEPTSGVDPLTRREFWTHINGLVRKGITIMITTHFMDEAEYCDTISLIYRGKNIATNTPTHLKALVQSANLPNPTLEDAFIELINTSERGVAIQ